jgi:hypothetical protein
MPDITDFNIGQGETFKILAHIYTETTSSVPLDITSCSFDGQLRENYTTDEVAARFTITKLEPHSSGRVFIYLYPEDTNHLYQRMYVYDIVMTNNGKNPPTVKRLLEGAFTIRPSVTR